MRAWARVAELVKAKTLSGGLVARCAPGLPFLLSEGMEVAFVPPQHDAPRRGRVTSVREDAKGAYLVTFDSVEGADDAERLAGCSCLVRRDDLDADALASEADTLEGFEVHDASCGFVGVVQGIVELPGQLLLSVAREGAREALVPLVDAFVADVDEDARRIDVDLPDGLLDL